ncbi:MAG: ABC transporter substrate-binding protein [Spirochaeta sp.]|jgi:iron complex transport system substrate-binding protein|nr:ABC transporter substrate-binding protein [Spirochaeta sp.]
MTYRQYPVLILLFAAVLSPLWGQPLQHATALSMDLSCEHSTVITIRDAWPGAEPLQYALVERGAPAPGGDGFEAVIEVPVRRIVSLSSTAIPHIVDLGMTDRLVGVDTGDYIYNAAVHERVTVGTIAEVGSGDSLDVEQIIAVQPDVVVTSVMGFDDPTWQRLTAAGVPVVVLADWRENAPLGRAEWIRLFGALFERDEVALRLFGERSARYAAMAERVDAVAADERPSVLLNAPWQGTWPVPAGESYVARLFADAGADYLWADRPGTGSLFLDLEAVLQRGAAADFWFNLNFGWRAKSDVEALDPRLTVFRPYRTDRMYHYIGRVRRWGANDFWESGAARPDLVLSDLIHVMHPELLPDHDLVYYRRLR